MKLLVRILAVVALALSPVWGFSGQVEARGEAYPVWPSFLSTGCQIVQGPTGSTTVVCGQGAFLLTQVNSGYACNQLDINITSYGGNPFLVTGTADSGSVNNSVSVEDTGDYYMTFPGFLTNNLITIQMSAPDGGSLTVGYIATSACPVATATPTLNPSSTTTNTPVPVTGTPTAIPTYTPFPSGHTTFTPTVTPVHPATATATATPNPAEVDCGDYSYPLLNCTGLGGDGFRAPGGMPPTHWYYVVGGSPSVDPYCDNTNATTMLGDGGYGFGSPGQVCLQDVVPNVTGVVVIRYQISDFYGGGTWYAQAGSSLQTMTYSSCTVGSGTYCQRNLGNVTAGTKDTFGFFVSGSSETAANILIDNVFVQAPGTPTVGTPTVGPTFSATPTPTSAPATATAAARLTLTAIAADATPTPPAIPGAMSTNIPTATECPGGCAVAAVTGVPGMVATVLPVAKYTAPFSQFGDLSLARTACQSFGSAVLPEPLIYGTPTFGSTNPLDITWTVPATNGVGLPDQIEPCSDAGVPSGWWDLLYWFSVLFSGIVFTLWIIGYVGRLSGGENVG